MPSKPWQKIRVVVEVSVRVPDGGHFAEKDLAWSVKRAVQSDGFWQDRKYLSREMQPVFGQVQVKEFSRVVEAMKRKGEIER